MDREGNPAAAISQRASWRVSAIKQMGQQLILQAAAKCLLDACLSYTRRTLERERVTIFKRKKVFLL
jgi:hypothetical protein